MRVREVSNDEGNRLLRIVRRSSGSVVTWRRAQMVLLSVQGMDVAGIAKVSFTSPDRVRDVINNFNADGFDSLYPKYAGGRPPTFTLPQRQEIKKIALSRPADHGLAFSTWSLAKLAEFLVAEGMVDDISHEGLRLVLRDEEVSFQAVKTWKQSTDPDFEAKKNRVLEDMVIPVGHRRSFLESIRTVRESPGRRPISRGPLETTAVDSSGREFPVEWTATWVPVRDGMVCRAFVRDISARKAAVAELISGAVTDGLTGLANRALLDDRLAHARARLERAGGPLAVMFVDLDRFRLVNDSLGHVAGDRVLSELAGRMKSVLRLVDTVARFGGDKFVVLCEDTPDHEAIRLAECIVAEIREPLQVDGQRISVGVSVGIAVADGRSAETADPLRDAEVAMYRAKELGRGRVEMFDERMRRRATGRLQAEADLRRALTSGELRVFYQPIMDTATEHMCGVEALVRWEHPERGLLPPSEFIPLAEETGLIVPLGAWVLRTARHDVSRWPLPEGFHLAVNLAVPQLQQEDLIDTVTAVLDQTGLAPSRLWVEITETGMMEQPHTATVNLYRLHDLGVSVAIDDLGTGYSSLLRLRHFPIDLLKIDRLFVSGAGCNPNDTALVAAIADLARTLGVSTLAQGVETPDQLDFIRSLGCRLAQGFRWSPPVSEPQARGLLAQLDLRPGRAELAVPRIR